MNKQSDILILGIDLGGTKILTAVIDALGNIRTLDQRITLAEKGPPAVMDAIWASAEHSFEQLNMDAKDIDAAGIGAPGPSNPEKGVVVP
jgi:glucokinase